VTAFDKGQTIYCSGDPATHIYLVMDGLVRTSTISMDREIVVDFFGKLDLFGESALTFCDDPRSESAAAVEHALVMSWSVGDIHDLLALQPRLAVALLKLVAGRSNFFCRRIVSLSCDKISLRLARSLLWFAERFGTPESNGGVKIMRVTHAVLAGYLGTSRELVTIYMNQLRADGCVRYSRRGISVQPDLLREWLGKAETHSIGPLDKRRTTRLAAH
jgi:CRP-like cAMP-binding protein